MLAIIITTLSYVMFAAFAGSSVLREATGDVIDYPVGGNISDFLQVCALNPEKNCTYGLHNSYQVRPPSSY